MTYGVTLGLFLCAAVLSLVSAAAGGFFALWASHAGRTGCYPIPSVPKIGLLRRKRTDDDDETPAPPPRRAQVGP
jgi:hypothetical protein